MSVAATDTVETKVPARMDRLPWSRWHWLMISALGVVWILDGLEVTIKGALGPTLKQALGLTTAQVGTAATIYLVGAVVGAAIGGYATDRWGRKRVFIWTIVVYLIGVLGTGLIANGFLTFVMFRFITGLGIGGEYAGIHSAIDELLPARVRGRVALAINGSYWIGTLLGSGLATLYLTTMPASWAWRAGFLTGALLAIGVMLLRAFVPESPRWLMVHGESREAEEVVSGIERQIEEQTGERLPEPPDEEAIELAEREPVGIIELARTMFGDYPRRSTLAGTLMTTQAFLYNALFFTYGLVLTTYFGVARTNVGLYLIPFAIGNFTGPVVLGPLFDKWGRKPMISGTYFLSAGLLAGLAWLFVAGMVSSITFTLGLTIIFFFASAAASSAYMTTSETFPLEIRAQAIGFFYIVGTAAGGVVGPWLFGNLIQQDNRMTLFYGYMIAVALMAIGGIVEMLIGFRAEQKSLEEITDPLSVKRAKERDQQMHGPLGLDPSNADEIRGFQEAIGVDEDGIIGPQTMGALRSRLQDADEEDRSKLAVDVTDEESVRQFQERYGLRPTGEVDHETRGALLAVENEPIVDPSDASSVRRFQRAYGIEPTGDVDRETQVAIAAIRAERDAGGRSDIDPLNPASVERFQMRYGLEPDGVIGPQVRGALRALRALHELWGGIDPGDPDAVTRFQETQGLETDGIIRAETREVLAARSKRLRREREERDPAQRGRPELDPAEVDSIKRFQTQHGLEPDGIVGERTVAKLREVRRELVGVDPTDPDSIRAFQREHGLEADGIIGPRTQGAIEAVRSSLRLPDPDAEPDEPEGRAVDDGGGAAVALDPADAASVRAFQRGHGLAPTGTVDRDTQIAVRVVEIERERQATESADGPEAPPSESEPGRPYVQRGLWAGFTYVATTPERDRDLDTELEELEEVLAERGPLGRSQLKREVGARHWGPGRFRQAFNIAVEEGRIGRDDSGQWTLTDGRDRAGALPVGRG